MNKQLLDRVVNLTDHMWKTNEHKGLLFGNIGVSLIYDSLYQITKQRIFKKRTEKILSQYMPEYFTESNLFTFFPTKYAFGLIGVYSAYNIIYSKSDENEPNDLLAQSDFECFIYETLSKIDSESNLSFFHGVAGLLQYLTTNPSIDKELLTASLAHLNNTLQVSTFNERFRNLGGQINLTVSHGITGFLLVVLNCYGLGNNKHDNEYFILQKGEDILQKYLQQRLDEYDTIPFRMSDFKRDLMICLFLLKFNDKKDKSVSKTFAFNCCEFILEKLELDLPEKFELGQANGLSGILECVRSIFLLVRQKKIKNWFEFHHNKLCNAIMDNSTYEHLMSGSFYDGACGALLTILYPNIEHNPNWRKLLLY